MKFILLLLVLPLVLSACSYQPQLNTNSSEKPDIESPRVVSTKVLNLSNQGLNKVDMDVFNRTELEEVDFSNNQLTGALPAQIGNLKNLRVLRAGNNLMTGVPAEVGQLSKLEELDLSNNKLTGLPNELSNLKNLKILNLSGNDYSAQDLQYIRDRLPQVNYILD